MSKVIKEFSRFAHQYDQHNEIQKQVAKTLISKIPSSHYKNILDLGCGSGAVVANLDKSKMTYDELTAFDSSKSMLDRHPSSEKIIKVCDDFNHKDFLKYLPQDHYHILISSSAIQWSTNLGELLNGLSSLADKAYFAIFTSGTFKTLHQTANVSSPIYSAEYLKELMEVYYSNLEFELHSYTLHFDSVREMFRYIKKSGVSAGEKKLGFKETKRLMESYPLDYLEFEVLFVEAKKM